jgi:hypothetical protein
MASDKEKAIARQGRIAALVVAGAMLFWLVAQWAGPQLGLAGRYALLIDFAAMAAFVWAFVVALQIWRARRDEE